MQHFTLRVYGLLVHDGHVLVADDLIREMSQDKLFGAPVVTEVLPLANYWPAEDYHQDFFEKNPYQGYCMAVAAPKVAKFRKTFSRLAKS